MQTKNQEIRYTTSDLSQMLGMYIVEPVRKPWKESVVDDDSGEIVEIDRYDIIFDRGEFITNEKLTEINFYLQTNHISEITISSQKRTGIYANNGESIYIATVKVKDKNRKILLYAFDLYMAIEILKDYLEQKEKGIFYITAIKGFNWATILRDTLEREDKDKDTPQVFYYYSIDIKCLMLESKEEFYFSYIVHTSDTNKAISLIIKNISQLHKKPASEFNVMIEQLKELSVADIIDYDFCSQYYTVNE